MERNISEFEESVIRLVHHEFAGMTQAEAARELHVSESMISRALDSIVEKAKNCRPIRILLPILTKQQYAVYIDIAEFGISLEATAAHLDMTVGSVRDTLYKIRKKGKYVPSPARHEAFHDGMEGSIKLNF
jgi:DNA-directed RNA polymerase specialized sigma24 family protein